MAILPKKISRFERNTPAAAPSGPGLRYHRDAQGSYMEALVLHVKAVRSAFKSGNFVGIDLKTVNLVLKGVVVALCVYFAVSFVASFVKVAKGPQVEIKVEAATETKASKIASFLKEATYYLEKARARDIFTMGVRPVQLAGGIFSRGPSPRIVEATANYRLVGISWSSDPDVMVEDTKNQRTFFLKEGQVLDNDVRLERVYKDKVVLSFAGEEIELR